MDKERKPEIPLFGEYLWLKEEVRYDPESNILRGYDGCYYIEVDFDRGVIRGRRLGILEVFEEGTIQFRDGENYKDAVEDIETVKERYFLLSGESLEDVETLEELAQLIREEGMDYGDSYALEAFEPDEIDFKELDKETLRELFALAGKDVPRQKQDVKSRKKKYNRGMSP